MGWTDGMGKIMKQVIAVTVVTLLGGSLLLHAAPVPFPAPLTEAALIGRNIGPDTVVNLYSAGAYYCVYRGRSYVGTWQLRNRFVLIHERREDGTGKPNALHWEVVLDGRVWHLNGLRRVKR